MTRDEAEKQREQSGTLFEARRVGEGDDTPKENEKRQPPEGVPPIYNKVTAD